MQAYVWRVVVVWQVVLVWLSNLTTAEMPVWLAWKGQSLAAARKKLHGLFSWQRSQKSAWVHQSLQVWPRMKNILLEMHSLAISALNQRLAERIVFLGMHLHVCLFKPSIAPTTGALQRLTRDGYSLTLLLFQTLNNVLIIILYLKRTRIK